MNVKKIQLALVAVFAAILGGCSAEQAPQEEAVSEAQRQPAAIRRQNRPLLR
jgi:PBP1b-binding outer membrane lipoprotein LpoB